MRIPRRHSRTDTRTRRTGRVPLDRALSKLGLASRTNARTLVLDGRVRVGASIVRDPRHLVVPERAAIHIDDVRCDRPRRQVLAFHKPRGVVTTRRDPEGRPTVFDWLGEAARGLQPVGRLDMASTGLLLFTNDTQLAHALCDPARRVSRRYVVTVRGRLTGDDMAMLSRGVDVAAPNGVLERLAPSSMAIRKASGRETHLIVELIEGRNRELRRLFAAVGRDVTRVHRVQFGPVSLGTLQPGKWREITDDFTWLFRVPGS